MDGHLGPNLKLRCGFDDHQPMKGFSQNQCRCKCKKSNLLNTLEELGADVWYSVGPEKW